jgi:hypothetical protein
MFCNNLRERFVFWAPRKIAHSAPWAASWISGRKAVRSVASAGAGILEVPFSCFQDKKGCVNERRWTKSGCQAKYHYGLPRRMYKLNLNIKLL